MTGYAPRAKTVDIDLAEFGGEGIIKVKGLNTRTLQQVSKINEEFKNDKGNVLSANLECSITICLNCIAEAPFEINRAVVEDFPPELTNKITEVALSTQNKLPLA